MEMTLEGRRAVVTGGASGIGLACARALIAAGAETLIADRAAAGAAVAAGIGAGFAELDVGDETAVESLAAQRADEGAAPDILIACAGVLQRPLPPDQLGWPEWDRILRVHLRGAYACCRSFGARMASGEGGAIVLISSVAGLRSGPLHAYGPAKAAVAHLARCLAAEWGPRGVRANAVAPGFTETPALARGVEEGVLEAERLRRHSALGRLVAAEEVAAAALFLASPLASAITGITLPVDAGCMAATDWEVYGGLRDA